jgi:tRNA(Ile)-lysidine synthetase-like protein
MEVAGDTQGFVEQEWVWTQALARQPRLPMAAGYLQPLVAGLCLREGDRLRVTLRQGGERCQPQGRAHSQSLKKLLQEYQVPAWQRDNLPLFWVNGQLAMVGNLWICQGFAAEETGMGWCWLASTK